MKIAILGAGNMGSAIACGLVRSGKFQAEEIVCTARTETTLERLRTQCPGVRTTTDNAAAVRDAAVVMLAVKPWLTEALIREIRREIDPDRAVGGFGGGRCFAGAARRVDDGRQRGATGVVPRDSQHGDRRAAEHDLRRCTGGGRGLYGAGVGNLPRTGRGDARRRARCWRPE